MFLPSRGLWRLANALTSDGGGEQISRVGQTIQSWARTTVRGITPNVVVVAAFRVGEYPVVFCRDIEGQKAFDEVCEAKIHFLKSLYWRTSNCGKVCVLKGEVLCSRRLLKHGDIVSSHGCELH
jgi:hypothetical protein